MFIHFLQLKIKKKKEIRLTISNQKQPDVKNTKRPLDGNIKSLNIHAFQQYLKFEIARCQGKVMDN